MINFFLLQKNGIIFKKNMWMQIILKKKWKFIETNKQNTIYYIYIYGGSILRKIVVKDYFQKEDVP